MICGEVEGKGRPGYFDLISFWDTGRRSPCTACEAAAWVGEGEAVLRGKVAGAAG